MTTVLLAIAVWIVIGLVVGLIFGKMINYGMGSDPTSQDSQTNQEMEQ